MHWLLTAFSIWEAVMATLFQHAENVGELEADELDLLLLHNADDVLFVVDHHWPVPLSSYK